jgi:hypothetical protein
VQHEDKPRHAWRKTTSPEAAACRVAGDAEWRARRLSPSALACQPLSPRGGGHSVAAQPIHSAQASQLASLAYPPAPVKKTMQMVCILLGEPPTWHAAQRLLRNHSRLCSRMKTALGMGSLVLMNTATSRKTIREYMSDPTCSPKVYSLSLSLSLSHTHTRAHTHIGPDLRSQGLFYLWCLLQLCIETIGTSRASIRGRYYF